MRGEDLTSDLIRSAYLHGAFPMGEPETGEIEFYVPNVRAVFPVEGIRVSRSLGKTLRSGRFEVRYDTAFEDVMRCCVRPKDNWITEGLIDCYTRIHGDGWAHSCESWLDGTLVGGVYGLALGGCFCAESMFHRETDASKVALWALVNRCRELGFVLFDAQMMNPHLRSLGALPMSHRRYLAELREALEIQTPWDSLTYRPGESSS
ncbi:MAG: leucyl/phenylalanyl-tRNA--protein transferase [Armatimonadetes bacterium]|nr:leucyl/phenylalanyl-tRNA--protein transferase [Armatimonadota bacterium]